MWLMRIKRFDQKMERLVGRRYDSLEDLKKDIEKALGKKVTAIIESESDRTEDMDLMIDYEIESVAIFTIFYLKDMGGRYYITEV